MKRLTIFIVAIALFIIAFPCNADVSVKGYSRKDGTYVPPHYRSSPDGNPYNNWSTKGNINPYTGEVGTKSVPSGSYEWNTESGDVLVNGYYREDGSYVQPYYRSSPDGNPYNNWSTKGNINPYTGEKGTVSVPSDSYEWSTKGGDVFVSGYYRSDGSYMQPHYRSDPYVNPNSENIDYSKALVNIEGINLKPADKANLREITTFLMQSKLKSIERSAYWRERGYLFNPNLKTAGQMDQQVEAFIRSDYWKAKGYNFDPITMTAVQMDQKVEAIEKADYWKTQGYNFDPATMSAKRMDRMLEAIERADYWKAQGYIFDPATMSAEKMNQKVEDFKRAAYWKAQGYNFDPATMSGKGMDKIVQDRYNVYTKRLLVVFSIIGAIIVISLLIFQRNKIQI